ncbi:MAG: YdiU family protein [Verrucomicrobiota bacterium]
MRIPFDNSYAQLGAPLSVPQTPEAVEEPALIRVNEPLGKLLGLPEGWLHSEEALQTFAGNAVPEGATPVASAYAGHQFGSFNPQLGDGRAVLLGEVVGANGQRFDIQLKGSGRTAWSRGGDGRSPLGPVIREYIVSEAMAALGVPTTRALAAVTTGERVYRDTAEPGAILTRVAASHLRVGTLQFFAAREDRDSLTRIIDYVLTHHYPDAAENTRGNRALALLRSVVGAQATLIARWQLLGFIHGVMNTDNMLLSGETVDYGPCAFMENFDPATVFSSIDYQGRYAYANQPAIGQWNLSRLAEAVLPMIHDDTDTAVELATAEIQAFPDLFGSAYRLELARKLGVSELTMDDTLLIDGLFEALEEDKTDFTLAFRYLAESVAPGSSGCGASSLFEPGQTLLEWIPQWMQRQAQEEKSVEERQATMLAASPAFIPRNHLIQQAIEAGEAGDYAPFHRLVDRLAQPSIYDAADRDLALPAKPEERVFRTFCGT